MKKGFTIKIYLLMIGSIATLTGYSQDYIVKKNTDEIKCKVVEIEDTKVKYKKFDNLNGPIYSINKDEIFMIKYANGKKETFSETNTKKEENKEATNNEKSVTNDKKEIFEYKHTFGIGVSLYNAYSNAFAKLGNSGGALVFFLRSNNFINQKKTLSVTTSVPIIFAVARNILGGYDDYGNPIYYDASYFGAGLIGKFNVHWFRTKTGSSYSGLGLGYITGNVSVSNSEYNVSGSITGLAWQLDVLGVQAQFGKHIGMFIELGIGTEGYLNSGLQIMW